MPLLDLLKGSPLYQTDEMFKSRVDRAVRREAIFSKYSLFNFDIEITTDCNLQCRTCYLTAPEKVGHLTLDQYETAMSRAAKLVDHLNLDGIWLTMTGGEPFMNPEFTRMIEVSPEYKVKGIALVTNGTFITPELAQEMEDLEVAEIMISLDGATPHTNDLIREQGAFEKIMKGIRALQKTNIYRGTTLTLTTTNVNDVEPYVDLCFREGLNYAWVNPPVNTGRLPHSGMAIGYETHLETMRKMKLLDIKYFKYAFAAYYNVPYYPLTDPVSVYTDLNVACPWGRSNLTIKTDGSVLPCLYSRDLILGNIFSDSIIDLYNHPLPKGFRDLSGLEEPCRSCKHTWFCGGCRARTFYLTGDWMARDPWCPLTRGMKEEDMKVKVGGVHAT